jgi:hypothetical protein
MLVSTTVVSTRARCPLISPWSLAISTNRPWIASMLLTVTGGLLSPEKGCTGVRRMDGTRSARFALGQV